VLYENILIKEALLFPIWFGPAWQELSGGCSLLFPFLPTALADLASKLANHHVSSLCHPVDRKVTNVTLRNVALLKSHTTPIVLLGGKDALDVRFENFTLGEVTSRGDRFPFTHAVECYNTTVSPSSLMAPGQLFENCAKAEVCTEHGPRKPFTPCCDESSWNPDGLESSEWWGTCGSKAPTSEIVV